MELSSGEKIHLDVRYQYSEILVKSMVDWSASEGVLKTMEDYSKYLGLVYSGEY